MISLQNKQQEEHQKILMQGILRHLNPTIEKPPTFTGRVDPTKGAPTPKRTTFKKANQFEDVVPTNMWVVDRLQVQLRQVIIHQ